MDATGSRKSGFVALLGRPNAGKSTLFNALLRHSLSIVSPRPQTTRHSILGILNGKDFQLCLLDTPGLLDAASDKLQQALIRTAERTIREDADLLLLVLEPRTPSDAEVEGLRRMLPTGRPLIIAINKSDLGADPAGKALRFWQEKLSPARAHAVSALHGEGLSSLLGSLTSLLPDSPPFYEDDRLSDRWERFFVAELVRGEIFDLYHEEIPHACAVEIEDFQETQGRKDLLRLVIYVERDGQKGILIGKQGAALRELQSKSRRAIEAFLGRKVDLDLWVKVLHNWRKDPAAVKRFGY